MAQQLTKEMWAAAALLFGEEFEWFAVDFDGSQYFLTREPINPDGHGFLVEGYLRQGEEYVKVNITGYACDDWRASKQRRPEGAKPDCAKCVFLGVDGVCLALTNGTCSRADATTSRRMPEAATPEPESFKHCSNCIFLTVECTGRVNREDFCDDWYGRVAYWKT